jgi:hypothetical protein
MLSSPGGARNQRLLSGCLDHTEEPWCATAGHLTRRTSTIRKGGSKRIQPWCPGWIGDAAQDAAP